ncbi:AarF/ABC1/UbiB kinase family protein [Paraconexibacter antarcticus]|uniref:AarF/ABC1/UbiB kinase family protein n=1 Tax=Paraconexibacter antarcticus TaxID=2949664 RepID=A0ABY5E1L5_9ACTN|nr:AarF/ABC1/UbiB kinase family protein [Paraconexibacter antarcticus]UTI66705.1 AarF/ABC1/UbiB kinase family protein [Paraconexibacter antarcticus]
MKSDEIKGSRLRRAAQMTGVAANVAAREATARAMSVGGTPGGREAAGRQQLKSAEALVKVFAGMRGAAMKVGQTLSAVDLGLVPEELRPQFQEILATLQHGADPVSFKAITKVIERDLGEKLKVSFADIDPEPIAAASIGQVHRATLHDGRDVAVKVQYPGIAEAIQADMQNLRLALKLLSAIAPGIDTGAIACEIRERITEELDYELEASNHREMARAYRGHPFVVVPGIVTSMCRERVLVSDFVDGARFASLLDAPAASRDRIGEILVRFYLNGPLRHRLLNGDPHPGNTLFLPDGRVAFLDFGFFKHLGDQDVGQLLASTRATYAGDADALLAVVCELGALPADPQLAAPFLENYQAIFGWLMAEEPLRIDASQTADMMRRYTSMRGDDAFAKLTLPAEHFVLIRSVMLLIGLLGQLRATGTWLDVAREWLFEDAPVTELGRLEAEFFKGRFAYRTEIVA